MGKFLLMCKFLLMISSTLTFPLAPSSRGLREMTPVVGHPLWIPVVGHPLWDHPHPTIADSGVG